ncbi:MAG: Lin0512 family protein [Promethearchaeota archaeon]
MNTNYKRFIVQIGMGVDQHGHDNNCTKAAMKAIKNAISRNCLTGLLEICNLKNPKDLLGMKVHVKIGAPLPETVDKNKVLKAVPFGIKSIEIEKGGLIAQGIMIKELGDTSDNIIVCIAAVTVSVKTS